MFGKGKKRKLVIEKLRRLRKEVNEPLNPVEFAYKQHKLVTELSKYVADMLERKI